MNRKELITAIHEMTNLTNEDAEKAVKAFTTIVEEQMKKGEKVQILGFGTFESSQREAYEGRNPYSGEAMTVAAAKSLKFKPSKSLKDRINS